MRYKIVEIELSKPVEPLTLGAHEQGLAIIARFGARLIGFRMQELCHSTRLTQAELEAMLD